MRTVRVQVSPLPAGEVPSWRRFIARMSAAERVELDSFAGATATFLVETASVARLHAQLRHAALRLGAAFAPAATGALSIVLSPDSSCTERPSAAPARDAHVASGWHAVVTYDLDRRRAPARRARGAWLAAAVRVLRTVCRSRGIPLPADG